MIIEVRSENDDEAETLLGGVKCVRHCEVQVFAMIGMSVDSLGRETPFSRSHGDAAVMIGKLHELIERVRTRENNHG